MRLGSFSQLIVKWQLFLITGVTVISVVLGSYYYYHSEELRIKQEKHDMLKDVADLKAHEISQFIKERESDLKTFAETQLVRDDIELWIKTDNEEAKEKLIQRMSLTKKYYDYENVYITSLSGLTLLSLDTIHKLDPVTHAYCKKVNELHKAEFYNLYFCPTHKAIHFDLIFPVKNDQHANIALIILRVNPERYLFPLIQSWPTQSNSAEVLLVRKDGNEVLFLNELKFQKNTALNLRIPLTSNDLPAVQAVSGRTGVFEGKDYRGVEVLSDLRPIPGTPWFIISKIDQAEIYSELKYKVFIIFLFATIILILLGISLAGLYTNRQKNIYRQLYLAKSALRQTEEEFKVTLYSIGDAVIITSIDSLIVMMNPVAEQLTGWKEQDAKGKPLDDVFKIIHEESREKIGSPVQKVIEQGLVVGLANNTLLMSKDGKEIPIADSGAPIREQDKEIIGVVLVFRDQTEERAAQKALQKSNFLIQNIVDNNPSLFYMMDTEGRFQMVNRGLADLFGLSKEDLDGKVREDLMPKEIAEQHRNNDLLVINSKQTQSFEEENMESDGKHSYLTSKFPLMDSDGKVYAVGGISTDITERKLAEDALQKSQSALEEAQQIARIGSWEFDIANDKPTWSNQMYDLFGRDPRLGEPSWQEHRASIHPSDWETLDAAVQSGKEYSIEFRILHPKMGTRWAWTIGQPVTDDTGKVVKLRGTVQDVTERKLAEEKLQESEKHFRSIVENSDAGYFFIDKDGIIRDVNNAWVKLYRYNSADEILGQHFAVIEKIDDLDQAKEFVEAIMRGDSHYMTGEFSRQCKDDTIGFHTFSARPVSHSGQILGIEGFILDTTERRKSIEQLRSSEAKFRAMAELSPMAIYASFGSDQKASYINEAFYKIFGFTLEDVPTVGHWWTKAFPDEKYRQQMIDQWAHNIEHANLNNTDVEALECVCTCKDGSEKIIVWVGKTIGDEFWAFGYDLTERVQTENALKESEELLRLSSELANVAAWEFDFTTNSMVRSINHDSLYGLEIQESWTFETFLNATHPDDREMSNSIIQKSAAIGGPDEYRFDFRVIYPDQSIHWLNVIGEVVKRNEKGEGILVRGFIIDITERAIAETKVREQLEELRRWYEVTLDREGRVLKLKQEVNELLKQHGEPLRYEIAIPDDPEVE
jgi:PAS domain S-box-containing protein